MKRQFIKYELFAILIIGILLGLVGLGLIEFNIPKGYYFFIGITFGWLVKKYWQNTFPDTDDEDAYDDVINGIRVGSIVRYTKVSGGILTCGTSSYEDAVVISLFPFILTSRDSTMRWSTTIKIEDFEHVETIDNKTFKHCMRRLRK